MKAPPKKERGRVAALKIAELIAAYRVVTSLQATFRYVFWLLEQRRALIRDTLANEGETV
jgi:hypothetical protein